MNQALLGHGFEGAIYVTGKLKTSYEDDDISVSKDYIKSVITQVTHCIGAHMDGFGACAKQQMFEVLIIGCADKVDAYLEQTIVRDDETERDVSVSLDLQNGILIRYKISDEVFKCKRN